MAAWFLVEILGDVVIQVPHRYVMSSLFYMFSCYHVFGMSHDVNSVQLVEGEATSHDVGESVNWNLDPSCAMADVVFFGLFYTLNPAVTV